jgi:hypothetical protein
MALFGPRELAALVRNVLKSGRRPTRAVTFQIRREKLQRSAEVEKASG